MLKYNGEYVLKMPVILDEEFTKERGIDYETFFLER